MRKYLKWVLPALLFLLIAPFTPKIDLAASSQFYVPGPDGAKGHFHTSSIANFMFNYGEEIGILIWACFVLLLFLSIFIPALKKWRRGLLVLILTLVLGAGILINSVFKVYWGRPRPKQIEEFGGKAPFRPFYDPDFQTRERQRSFPSGHAAMGFYYLTLCVVASRYKNRPLMIVGVIATLLMGVSLSILRIAQGGHFVSDVLFSAIVMWYSALFCDWLIFDKLNRRFVR